MKKRNAKRTLRYVKDDIEEEVKQEVRQDVKRELKKDSVMDGLKRSMNGMLPHEMYSLKNHIEMSLQRGVDIGYLKTVLFPE